jgi:excisionase family DNA binding protein
VGLDASHLRRLRPTAATEGGHDLDGLVTEAVVALRLPPHEAANARMTNRLLTARELANYLGFSAATIVDWSERNEIPSFKIGGRLRFNLSEVEAWLEQRRNIPQQGGTR